MDDQGNVAEDLRSQILGQLSERLNYDRLYQEALSDPELKRTAIELEAALSNAREAREVVFDLFQDLDGFSLDEYKPFSDVSSGMGRLVEFLSSAASNRNLQVIKVDERTVDLVTSDGTLKAKFTLDRDTATSNDKYELMGLDHPLLQEELGRWRSVQPESLGVALGGSGYGPAVLTIWMIDTSNAAGEHRSTIQTIAVSLTGTRLPSVERQAEILLRSNPAEAILSKDERMELFAQHVEPTLQRELRHKGAAAGEGSYSAELIGYIELVS